ncbi:DUF1376 domain-containing protein [Rhizobium sp. Leaf453]|uniref:DUF1376 domain-containing protein n=1 Tax=Rhizobium sp. Leaf453 TaxID=1736380 RepID=UPI000712E3FB|nr:DUF1376 domain-containing protein [Rhizobium sp. Leaf453]KQT96977.1 hypothetical protein ASG68_08450 [Rhizobium sp. Leaf453]
MAEKPQKTKIAPWFRLFPAEFLSQVGQLKAIETGVYIVLLCAMHERGEPIQADYKRLARRTNTTVKAVFGAIEVLVETGLIDRSSGDLLWSTTSERETNHRDTNSKNAQQNARIRWEETQRNQRAENASASKKLDVRGKRSDGQPPPGAVPSYDELHHFEQDRARDAPGPLDDEEEDDCPF